MIEHLLFKCPTLLSCGGLYRGGSAPLATSLLCPQVVEWMIQHHSASQFVNLVYKVVLAATVYHVWGGKGMGVFFSIVA